MRQRLLSNLLVMVIVMTVSGTVLAALNAYSVKRAEIIESEIKRLSDGTHEVHTCIKGECRGQVLIAVIKGGQVADWKISQGGKELREIDPREFGRVPDGGKFGSVGQTAQGDCFECVSDNDGNEHCYQVPCPQ